MRVVSTITTVAGSKSYSPRDRVMGMQVRLFITHNILSSHSSHSGHNPCVATLSQVTTFFESGHLPVTFDQQPALSGQWRAILASRRSAPVILTPSNRIAGRHAGA